MEDERRQSTSSRYAGGMTAQEYRQALRRLSEPPDDEAPLTSPFAMSPPASDAPPSPAPSRPAAVSARLATAMLPATAAALRRLGRRTTAVMWVGVVLSLAAFVVALVDRGDTPGAGSLTTAPLTDSATAAYMLASGLLGVWLVGGGVVFVVWLSRVYAQAAVLRPARFSWRPGWTIGGWFVPLLNLYLPYRLTADISRSVNDGVLASIKIWWTLLLLGVLVSVGVAGMRLDTRVAHSLGAVLSLGAVIGHALLLCAALAAAVLVRAVNNGVVVATQRLAPAPAPSDDAGVR